VTEEDRVPQSPHPHSLAEDQGEIDPGLDSHSYMSVQKGRERGIHAVGCAHNRTVCRISREYLHLARTHRLQSGNSLPVTGVAYARMSPILDLLYMEQRAEVPRGLSRRHTSPAHRGTEMPHPLAHSSSCGLIYGLPSIKRVRVCVSSKAVSRWCHESFIPAVGTSVPVPGKWDSVPSAMASIAGCTR